MDRTVNFATQKINEANAVIAANGLDFNQGSGSGSGNHSGGSGNTDRPSAPSYEAGSIADLEAQYKKLEEELKNTNVSDDRLQQIEAEKAALLQ